MSDNTEKVSKYEITNWLRKAYQAKIYIISFAILGLLLGFYFKPKESETAYFAEGLLYPNSTNGEAICYLMRSLNNMDAATRAKKMNIPLNISKKLIFLSTAVTQVGKTNDQLSLKPHIKYNFQFYGKSSFKQLYDGLFYYINSDPYIQSEHKQFLNRRNIKFRILQSIDYEMDYHDNFFKSNKLYLENSKLPFTDLYRLKLDYENDVKSDSSAFTAAYIDIPYKTANKRLDRFLTPGFVSFFFAIFGFLTYLIKNNKKLIVNEIKAIIQV